MPKINLMKILNVLDVMNPVLGGGGTERSCQMSRYLVQSGEKVDILTTNWHQDKEYIFRFPGVNCYSVGAWYFRYLFPFGVKNWLKQNIRNYDLLHLSKNWSLLAQIAGIVAAKQNIPYVFSCMGFVAVHNRSRILKNYYRKYLTIPLVKKAAACIAVTDEEAKDLVAAGADPDKVHLIPNGIIPEDFLHRDDEHFRKVNGLDNRKIILYLGQMNPLKGVHLLIDAFSKMQAKLDGWVLVLIGTDTLYRKAMKKKVAGLGLKNNVVFLDPVFGRLKSEAYHAAEFLVVPSIKDAMTIVAPEAACCRRPVLLTKTSGFGGLADCGGAIEVDPDAEGIASGLAYLTVSSCNLKEMGEKGYAYVVSNFRWEKIALKYRDLFETVIARHRKI